MGMSKETWDLMARMSRRAMFYGGLVLCLVAVFAGQWWIVAMGSAWGILLACAMQFGMRHAAPDARVRKPNRVTATGVIAMLVLVLFLPASIGLLGSGVLLGLTILAVIALAFGLTTDVCNRCFGPKVSV